VIGTILTAGFSEFGTDAPLPGEDMVESKSPFNLTLGGVVWKVVNTDLADVIEESNDPTSEHYMKISASWELGFTDYDLIVLEGEEKNIEDAVVISDPKEKESLKENLKIFGGSGELDDGKYVYRKVINTVIPLGIGFTETPAADVKGVFVKRKEVGENLAENNTINPEIKIKENISQTDKNNVIKEKRLAMKIKSLKDIRPLRKSTRKSKRRTQKTRRNSRTSRQTSPTSLKRRKRKRPKRNLINVWHTWTTSMS
jgi:hypothetical protein